GGSGRMGACSRAIHRACDLGRALLLAGGHAGHGCPRRRGGLRRRHRPLCAREKAHNAWRVHASATPVASLDTTRAARAMSFLRNLESKIANLVEGTFSRAFSSEVRPIEIARKLAREMEEHKSFSV